MYDALKGRGYRDEYELGKMTTEEFWKTVLSHYNVPGKHLKEIKEIWHYSWRPQNGMRLLVRKLRKKYRVVVLSGNFQERIEYLNKKHRLDKEFHECHYSFDYGITKPDPKFFANVTNNMKLKPKDCIVVDDMQNFLAGVQKMGAKTILFKNAKQLEKELRKIGVEV